MHMPPEVLSFAPQAPIKTKTKTKTNTPEK